MYATDAWAIHGRDVNVALFSPVRAPRISDDVVFLSRVNVDGGAITYNQDSVVEVGATSRGVEDA